MLLYVVKYVWFAIYSFKFTCNWASLHFAILHYGSYTNSYLIFIDFVLIKIKFIQKWTSFNSYVILDKSQIKSTDTATMNIQFDLVSFKFNIATHRRWKLSLPTTDYQT